MRTVSWILVSSLALAGLMACNGDKGSSGTPSASTTAEPSATETTTVSSAAPETTSSAAPEDSADTDDSAKPDGTKPTGDTPPPKGTASATAGAKKKYNCGSKGQKACPMQGWMKGVMARAIAGGDPEKIAKALNTIAAKPVAGFGSWSGIAAGGAAKAAAGDIDGAKAACKKCHALYQKKYVATMRDRPW